VRECEDAPVWELDVGKVAPCKFNAPWYELLSWGKLKGHM
jgi:hypothetical protein